MKRKIIALLVIHGLVFQLLTYGQETRENYHSVIEVYTDPTINDGDDIQVVGYYTDTTCNLLLDFYGDFDRDMPFDPHTILTLTGMVPPANAWHGGYILVSGMVTFADRPESYYPEDSLMAYLNAYAFTVYIPGESIPAAPENDMQRPDKAKPPAGKPMNRDGCDPCKFAFLLSGGVDTSNNHAKYWENLVALYRFKVDSMGYCDSNVFVHYFKGNPRDNRIPAARVIKADSAKIDSSMQLIANRVASCNDNEIPATFQKMVTNHGEANGDIDLLGNKILKPDHLKALQQIIIDSCCRTVYDEFIQCYGGYSADEMTTLDTKNKATIFINSAADKQTGYSPHNAAHPYLTGKITTLDTGGSYGRAVVNAKLAYDNFLQLRIQHAHEKLVALRAAGPETPDRNAEIAKWLADSTDRSNRICKSRNVVITPFNQYGQWQKYVVPPGGQLTVKFSGTESNSGNVTVYQEHAVTGEKIKVKEWNWNHPGSERYDFGNEQRAINGYLESSTTFWIRNDDGTSRLEVKSLGTPVFSESPSNETSSPGFSFGGRDFSFMEFSPIINNSYYISYIDQLNISLSMLPAILGPGYVPDFTFTFPVDPYDEFWSQMELTIDVHEVISPGILDIYSSPVTTQEYIDEPGTYNIPMGDFCFTGSPFYVIRLKTLNGLKISLDSWGFRSVYVPVDMTTTWTGGVSSDWNDPANWSYGVPGKFHHVTIMPGIHQPVIVTNAVVKSITISEGASIITAPGAFLKVHGH